MKKKQLIQAVCKQPVRKLLAALLLLAVAVNLSAADFEGDTLEVRFRLGLSDLDLSYADNEQRINEFVARVKAHYAFMPEHSLKMDVYGGASPEGPNELNRRLGEQRGISLKQVLMQRLTGIISQITVVNQGARWGGLYNMVEKSDEPWKYEVLDVLMKAPEDDGWQMDPREQKLRKMKNGTVWNQLLAKYLPALRTSGSAVVAPMSDAERERLRRRYGGDYCDTVVIRDTIVYLPEPCPRYEEPIDSDWVWALKTNLLLWGVAAPNGQIEFPLGRSNRWSIEGEVFWPWFIWSHNVHAHQCGNLGLELRYWLGNRKKHHTLDGWHIGLGGAAGYYDFEWKKHEGYQGEYLNIYCNLGYQHRWGRRKQWAIDGGIALGWIPTKYREYIGSSQFPVGHEEIRPDGTKQDPHLMWQKTSSKNFFGATHANITLAYMFHTKKQNHVSAAEEVAAPIAPTATSYTATPSQPTDAKAAKLAKQEAKANEKRLKQEAKDNEKLAKAEAKMADERAKAEAKEAKEKAKRAKAEAKAAEEKAPKAEKVKQEKAPKADTKAAEKSAKAQAKEDAKRAKAQAKEDAKRAKAEALAAAKAQIEAEKAAKNAK